MSLLDDIPGVGEVRKKALLLSFGDLSRIREATIEELTQVEGIGKDLGEKIHAFFHNDQRSVEPSTG
jgi:excinuclease ABC subunit C